MGLYAMLRAMSYGWGILRAVIETRKDQLMRIPWDIRLINASAKSSARDRRVQYLKEFFKKPDRKHRWQAWCRLILEDLLVIDAPAIYIWRSQAGTPYALECLDGSTVKVLIDDAGRVPDPPSPAYQQCYSADTEVLTDRGWVRWPELRDTWRKTRCATRAPDGSFQWQRATYFHEADYAGPMWHFGSRALDLLVSPNHRMLVTRVPHALRDKAERRADGAILEARDLAEHYTRTAAIPLTARWTGVEIGEQRFPSKTADLHERRLELDQRACTLRKAGLSYEQIGKQLGVGIATAHRAANLYQKRVRRREPNEGLPVTMSGDDFCAFMGAYLAEGSCNLSTGGTVAISQRPYGHAFGAYKELIERITGEPARHVGDSFLIHRAALVEYLRQFGHARDKWIPKSIMNAPPRQLDIFWRYFHLGDGDRHRNRLFTSSRILAGQLQEIALKLGYSASIRTAKAHLGAIVEGNTRRAIHSGELYTVSVRKASSAIATSISKRRYSGKIYCASVPNEVLYVRRNGKPAWCGNTIKGLPMVDFRADEIIYAPMRPRPELPIYGYSPVEQCFLEITEGIRRTLYQLDYWSEGSVPDLIVTVPEGWTPAQISQFQAYTDALLSGNLHQKSKIRFLPGGMKPFDIKSAGGELLKSDYDEWLARIVCFAFSISPQGFVKMMNRATAESSDQAAKEEGLYPLMSYFESEIMNPLIQEHFGYSDIEFKFQPRPEVDALKQAQALQIYVQSGVINVDEARGQLGLPKLSPKAAP
jgi:hypothetical protein